jgi:hypothetical protein
MSMAISITAYWMTVITIPFTQLNVTLIGLGFYIIQKCALYPSLLQPRLQMKVYNVGAQAERQIGVLEVTDSDTFNIAWNNLACI